MNIINLAASTIQKLSTFLNLILSAILETISTIQEWRRVAKIDIYNSRMTSCGINDIYNSRKVSYENKGIKNDVILDHSIMTSYFINDYDSIMTSYCIQHYLRLKTCVISMQGWRHIVSTIYTVQEWRHFMSTVSTIQEWRHDASKFIFNSRTALYRIYGMTCLDLTW